ncbi:MAG: methyltransferase domain-containing protein [Candidatus Coatesbacteria bacterium]|nr:methyltransferase domain-containing protein [Candidatus Coatesbacteria bacterium]
MSERLKAMLGSLSCRRFLDAASGTGDFLAELREAGAVFERVVALDLEAHWLIEGRERPAEPRPFHIQADLARPPFPPASFDAAGMANGLHHLAEPAAALGQLRRLLVPGGRLIIKEGLAETVDKAQANRLAYHTLMAELDAYRGRSHRPSYTERAVLGLLTENGFTVKERLSYDPHFDGDYREHMDPRLERLRGWIETEPLDEGVRNELRERYDGLRRDIERHGVRPQRYLAALARRD